ncbi:MAG: DUF423 domain-containing protein [Myxococcota bacterium]|nr:DUF423 domain-containing protein [Myxococcota bacterium]
MTGLTTCGFVLALAVGLGAFGAHGLKNHLSSDALSWWETATNYHFWHGLALGLVALAQAHQDNSTVLRWSRRLFIVGLVLFCGSLYIMALTNFRWLGMITPLGGTAFLIGWCCFGLAFRNHRRP